MKSIRILSLYTFALCLIFSGECYPHPRMFPEASLVGFILFILGLAAFGVVLLKLIEDED
ncbi:MAG: hypothetical protein ACYS7Y_19160 [Planctomycetota bacterium]|jgi:hypothetical protein